VTYEQLSAANPQLEQLYFGHAYEGYKEAIMLAYKLGRIAANEETYHMLDGVLDATKKVKDAAMEKMKRGKL